MLQHVNISALASVNKALHLHNHGNEAADSKRQCPELRVPLSTHESVPRSEQVTRCDENK
jgi:hypothetical protein